MGRYRLAVVAVIVMILVVAVAVVFVFVVATVVANFVLVVPLVVVVNVSVRAIPITGVEAATFVARSNPARATVGRAGPIAFMPAIAAGVGIPVTADPEELRAGLSGHDDDGARWWGRANLNTDGNLGFGWNGGEKKSGKCGRFQQSFNHSSLLELVACETHIQR